jgi:hypothetical protein
MKIVTDSMTFRELQDMAAALFDDMVKAVVDVRLETLALDAELHADLEALLLEHGSSPADLWGINLYPALSGEEFLEFDSMINVRPGQGNRSRGVDDDEIRRKIADIVVRRIDR